MAITASPFAISQDLAKYDVSLAEYLKTQDGIDGLVVGAAVFHPDGSQRLLLVQRAASDFMPNLWETPGGMAEAALDRTVLEAAARELFEESGLQAAAMRSLVSTTEFRGDDGKRYQKLTFEVAPRPEEGEGRDRHQPRVKLDPNEHQDFVWASAAEFRAGAAGDKKLVTTGPNQTFTIRQAFSSGEA